MRRAGYLIFFVVFISLGFWLDQQGKQSATARDELASWAVTGEVCDVRRDQIRVIAQAKLKNPSVSDAALIGPVGRADRYGTFDQQPREAQIAIIHNMAALYVGKYRDPVTGRIEPDADANQFFLNCTLAPPAR